MITLTLLIIVGSVCGEIRSSLDEVRNDFVFKTPGYPLRSPIDVPLEKFYFTPVKREMHKVVRFMCRLWDINETAKDCYHVEMKIKVMKTGEEKTFCGHHTCSQVSFITMSQDVEVSFRSSAGVAIEWFAEDILPPA